MGQELNADLFCDDQFADFYQKLSQETAYLKTLIEKKQFSKHPLVAGFEVEAYLVDQNMRAAPNNIAFLKNLNDPLTFPELAKFNIEFNSTPHLLNANVFSLLHESLKATWDQSIIQAQQLMVICFG